jgi:hypothetical protein
VSCVFKKQDQKMLIFCMCMCTVFFCVWLKYLKRTVICILMCCLCVCFTRTSCPFLKQKIVRLNTSHVRFVVFFLAFCFIVHTGLFSVSLSLAFYSRKTMHLRFLFFFFSYILLLLLFWFDDDDDDDDYVYGMHSLICFSLICYR